MDNDMFPWEDEELLSSLHDYTLDEEKSVGNLFPLFDCSGELRRSRFFLPDTFFSITNGPPDESFLSQLSLFGCSEQNLEIDPVFENAIKLCRNSIQILFANSKAGWCVETERANSELRCNVTEIMITIISFGNDLPKVKIRRHMKRIRMLLNTICSKDSLVFFSSACKPVGKEGSFLHLLWNKRLKKFFEWTNSKVDIIENPRLSQTSSPSYHFLHGFLEWHLLDLLILNKLENIALCVEDLCNVNLDEFDLQFQRVLESLVILSSALFNKVTYPQYIHESPFPCKCVQEMWVLLWIVREKLNSRQNFWTCFGKLIKNLEDEPGKFGIPLKNVQEFTVWLLKGLIQLAQLDLALNFKMDPACFEANRSDSLLEKTTRSFLESDPSEERLRRFLSIISSIMLENWPPKSDNLLILWEYFYKKIDCSVSSRQPVTVPFDITVIRDSSKNYVDGARKSLSENNSNVNRPSYLMFLTILGKMNARLNVSGQGNQLQKIFGRIYSKFSTNKILAYTETGIQNFIKLLITLALSGNLTEIFGKLKCKLLSVPLIELNQTKRIYLTRGHLSLMILCIEKDIDISAHIFSFFDQVKALKNDMGVFRTIAENMFDLLKPDTSFVFGEECLIDTWLIVYLNGATQGEREALLAGLHFALKGITQKHDVTLQNNKQIYNFTKSVTLHLLPYIKQNFCTTFSTTIAELAADLCVLLYCVNKSDEQMKLINFFLESNCIDKQISVKFVLAVLQSKGKHFIDSSVMFKFCIQGLVLLTIRNEDVLMLTNFIVDLKDFALVSGLSREDLLTAEEPLAVFMTSVGKVYSSCKDTDKKSEIADRINRYLTNFEKWISDKNEKTEVLVRFYKFIAIVIYNCSPIVYTQSKITCFLHVAITRFILPPSLQIGKPPATKLSQLVHKIWASVVQGIGKLNFNTDVYLKNTLSDLIVKWLPHFKLSSNVKQVARPFVACVACDNRMLQTFILEKLAASFLTTQRRQAEPHSCLTLSVFLEIVETIQDDCGKLETFLRVSNVYLLEHLILVDKIAPSYQMIMELLKKISCYSAFKNSSSVREVLFQGLKSITTTHLSYHTFFYFDMLTSIAGIFPTVVERAGDFLKEQVELVERKRGFGVDSSLRNALDKLNRAVIAAKSK